MIRPRRGESDEGDLRANSLPCPHVITCHRRCTSDRGVGARAGRQAWARACATRGIMSRHTVQSPVQGALVFPLQKVATVLSTTFGSNDPQEELEFHDCRIPLALHGSLYAPNRGVYVRLQSAIFGGCVICDHDNDIGVKGSQEWHNYNIRHRGMTARESRAAAHMRGGLNTWWAQNPGRR